jgi:hypothetical protein
LKALNISDGSPEKKDASARKPQRKLSRASSGGSLKKAKDAASRTLVKAGEVDDEDKENQMVVDIWECPGVAAKRRWTLVACSNIFATEGYAAAQIALMADYDRLWYPYSIQTLLLLVIYVSKLHVLCPDLQSTLIVCVSGSGGMKDSAQTSFTAK